MTSMPEVAGRNDDRYFGAVTGAPELVVRPLSGWNAQGVYSELSESSRRRLLAAVNNLSPADHDAVVTSRGHWHCLPETNAERLPGSDCAGRDRFRTGINFRGHYRVPVSNVIRPSGPDRASTAREPGKFEASFEGAMMNYEHDEGSYVEDSDEQQQQEEGDSEMRSRLEEEEGGRSRSYLRFSERVGVVGEETSGENGGHDHRVAGVGEVSEEGMGSEEGETEDISEDGDSLASATESEVLQKALDVLGLDIDGRVLPLSAEQDLLVQSLWIKPGATDLRPGLSATSTPSSLNNSKPCDPRSALAPHWIRRLDREVLFSPPSDPAEEEKLVTSIKKNLVAIVNNLSEDQWRYPPPPSFLPTSTSMTGSSSTNQEGLENGGGMWQEMHDAYLEREFNPLTLVRTHMADDEREVHPTQPPRELWMGEDEDEGLDSEASLRYLLSTPSPAVPPGSANLLLNHSGNPALGSARPLSRSSHRSFSRPAKSSSLTQQVSRLGMTE
ncbi:hypothetical protein PCANC_02534 [Puccinia coronata f. sp. avenae]|uniref:Uncharacterized protein n=1 Tax=Puccinia coronata f. sp. avenae TaxID=200324 RepID=A0A2N5VYE0_9BASI|nr:hypothetical protein PCANC_02534 [Puccinia coronata f. sp. avenae]